MNATPGPSAAWFSVKSSNLCLFTLFLFGALLLTPGLVAQAQSPAPPPAPPPAQALARTQAQLAQAQAKVTSIQEEVLGLDREIDARVDELVALLKGARDSTESRTEVMTTKKAAIESLQKLIQAYAQERGRRLGQIQGPGSSANRTDLQGEVAALDAEINARVSQVVELAASMSTREETERYDTYYADFGVAKVEREEYRANQKQISRADQTQTKLAEDLEKAIADLQRQIALVPQRLPRAQQESELARLQGLLAARQEDLRALSYAAPSGGRAFGDREADQLLRDLHFAQEDVRSLWAQLLAKANLLSVERQRVRQLEARVNMIAAETSAPPDAP